LPPDLQRQAAKAAQQRGLSLGELVRRALVREVADAYHTQTDSFWSSTATFRSGRRTLSEKHDDVLYGPIRR